MGRHGRKHGGKFHLGQERLELTRVCPVRHCAGFLCGLAYRAPVRVRLQHRQCTPRAWSVGCICDRRCDYSCGGHPGHDSLGPSTAPPLTVWQVWFTSDALGIITAAPLVVGLFEAQHDPPNRRELLEGVLAVVVVAAASLIGFGSSTTQWITIVPLALLMPFLVWQAARCRPIFVAAAACVVAIAIVLTIKFGVGRLGDPSVPHSYRVNAAQVAMLAITGCSLILAALFAERRTHEATLEEGLDHQRALNAELDHRVKNVLATVCAIITQTRQESTSHLDFLARLDSRITSLARTHELLSRSNWRGVPLARIVECELAPYPAGTREVGGPNVTLKAEGTQVLAMVLHELSTNAAKYGAFTSPTGRLLLRWWWQESGRLAIEWKESTGPPVTPPSRSGYGTSLIRELVPFELGGVVDLVFAPDGIYCRLEIPEFWIRSGDAIHLSSRKKRRGTGHSGTG